MSESSEPSKKRARKSKLVLRDCIEDDDEENSTIVQEPELAVQALLPKLRTGLDRDIENYENSAPPPMEFSINVEVEECEEDYTHYEENIPDDKSVKQCNMQESVLCSEIEELSKTTTSLADKQLEIEIRNHWGKIPQTLEESPFEVMIQLAISGWRVWSSQSKHRESFLLYKCYVCEIGWWHMMPFLDHVKEHPDIHVNIEVNHHECYLVADNKTEDTVMRDVHIEGECWRCLRSFEEHMALKRKSNMYYFCNACNSIFFTCTNLIHHEGICQKYHKLYLKHEVRHETDWRCNICYINCLTKARYDSHLIAHHSVYSYFVVSTVAPKICAACNGKYIMYNLHICPKKADNYQCKYCCRRYQSRHFAGLHEKMTKGDHYCRICNKYLKKQCMEMEHIVRHSRNYTLSYRCTLCAVSTLFPNEYSLRRHRVVWHGLRMDKRRSFLEVLVVPKKCLQYTRLQYKHTLDDLNRPIETPADKSVAVLPVPELRVPELHVAVLPMAEPKKSFVNKEEQLSTRNSEIEKTHHSIEKINEDVQEAGQEMQVIEDATDIKKEIEEAENAITNLLQQRFNKKPVSVDIGTENLTKVDVKTEMQEIKIEKEDYEEIEIDENDTSYDEIDIDIKKEQDEYIETLSKVFQASKNVSNRKMSNTSLLHEELMNKENNLTIDKIISEEVQIKVEDPLNMQKQKPKKSKDIVRKYKGKINVPNTAMLQNELLLTEKTFHTSNKSATETMHTSFLQEELTVKANTIQVAKHIMGEEVSAKSLIQVHQTRDNVFQVSKNITGGELQDVEAFIHQEVVIKEEPVDEDEYEDDIIVLNGSFDSTIDSENADLKNEPRSDVLSENSMPDIENMSTLEPDISINLHRGGNKKSYKCKKCAFEGPHRLYKEHKVIYCQRRKIPGRGTKVYVDKEYNLWTDYACTKCGEVFNSLKKYAEHFTTAHGLSKGACPQCSVVRADTGSLVGHLTSHIKLSFVKVHMIKKSAYVTSRKDRVFHCKECSETVKYKNFFSHWESHMRLRDVRVKIEKDEQDETASSTESKISPEKLRKIIEHLTSTLDGYNQNKSVMKRCIVCRREFGRRNDVKRHLVEHLLSDAYVDKLRHGGLCCQVCQNKFQKPDKYKQHMRQHASMPLYKCELCNRAFSDSSNFAKHKKVHNLLVLVCDICHKKFHSKVQLEIHMEMHLVNKPISCRECDKIFHSQSSYNKHYRVAHDKIRPKFTCVICRSRFLCLRDKWDHMWHVHKERKFKADCPFCEQSFRKFQDVKSHVKDEHQVRLSRSKTDESVILYEYER